jgi:hypothetical protein
MIAYHGTVTGGIKTLEPFAHPLSDLQQPVVYLSTIKVLAAVYIWDKGYRWMTYEIRDDGMPVYNETFQDGLSYFYDGVKGYIYMCEPDSKSEKNTKGNWTHIITSTEPVEVREAEIVENVYERLLKFENDGELIINRFENLPEEVKNREKQIVLNSIKNLELWKRERPLADFVSEKFPDLWDEALRSLNIK